MKPFLSPLSFLSPYCLGPPVEPVLSRSLSVTQPLLGSCGRAGAGAEDAHAPRWAVLGGGGPCVSASPTSTGGCWGPRPSVLFCVLPRWPLLLLF